VHYYLLSLFPALWLITISPRWSYTELLGVLSIILTSDFLPLLLGWHKLERYTVACGLIPLWLGILTVVAGRVETFKLNLAKA
jgi:cadmium resistance protein CadD (predicted permease)